MANVTVTIANDGTPSPASIQVDIGDTVSFQAGATDIVLCVAPSLVFGAERFEIPATNTLQVIVQNYAPPGPFEYITKVGDLDAPCRGRGDDEESGEGGGTVGGGPG